MKYLGITEFAEEIGVHPTTVRKYEEDGMVLPHHRTIGGKRLYTQEQVQAFFNGDFESPLLRGQR